MAAGRFKAVSVADVERSGPGSPHEPHLASIPREVTRLLSPYMGQTVPESQVSGVTQQMLSPACGAVPSIHITCSLGIEQPGPGRGVGTQWPPRLPGPRSWGADTWEWRQRVCGAAEGEGHPSHARASLDRTGPSLDPNPAKSVSPWNLRTSLQKWSLQTRLQTWRNREEGRLKGRQTTRLGAGSLPSPSGQEGPAPQRLLASGL